MRTALMLLAFMLLTLPGRAQDDPKAARETKAGVTVHRLTHLHASEAAHAVRALLGHKLERPVKVVADERTNSLLVAGDRTGGDLVRRVVEALDQAVSPEAAAEAPAEPPFRYQRIDLDFVDAPAAASILESLLSGSHSRYFRLVAAPGGIIAKGDADDMRQIGEVLKLIDVRRTPAPASAGHDEPLSGRRAPAPARPRSFKRIALAHAETASAVPIIIELMAVLADGRVKVLGDPRTNSILVAGGAPDIEHVTSLVAQLDLEE